MSLLYYIDGYNVLHQSALLRPLLKADFETARDGMIEKVARFCGATGHRACIVFDGRGRRTESVPVIPSVQGLEVSYSSGQLTADAVIERLVYTAESRRHLVVVSGDRSLRDLCRNLGALVMNPDNFLVTVREAAGHVREALNHPHRPLRVEDRLNDETLHYLKILKHKLER